jgi:crossover junction endodeoxyribonuclease RusA
VLGEPQPQGSKTIVQTRGRRPRVIEDNPDTGPWRERVERHAIAALAGADLLDGPLRLRAVFVFARPRSHFGTGRNAGRLKPSAPLYVRTRPDVDKLLRALGDAVTQTLITDDSRIVDVRAEKHYGSPPCAHVVIEQLAPDEDRPAPEEVV